MAATTRTARACLLAAFAAAAACASPATRHPAPAPAADAGAVQVVSHPAGARVSIDGSATDYRTPTEISAVPAGARKIALALPGHRGWSGEVEVPAGGRVRVEATLRALGKGSVTVTSVPAGAEIILDGEPAGLVTPAELGGLAIGTHTISLRREGYEFWAQAVVVMQDRHLRLQAALQPSRADLGHLAVQTHPPRARIALDGYPTGKLTPDTLYAVQAGSHSIDLDRDGYRPWRGTVTVREGRTESLLVNLARLPEPDVGSARVDSDPPGALISIDGVPLRRRTPALLEPLESGTYLVELTRPGYLPWQGSLAVSRGEEAVLSVRLASADRERGGIRVESEPPGAAVLLDGRAAGVTTPAVIPDLEAGEHRLELSAPGHAPWAGTVRVLPGATVNVRTRLSGRPYLISALVVAHDEGVVDVEFTVRHVDGSAASGVLELEAAPGARWVADRTPLSEGVARGRLYTWGVDGDVGCAVRIGPQRESFLLRHAGPGWSVLAAP